MSFVDVEVDCVAPFLLVSLPSATVAPARALCWIAVCSIDTGKSNAAAGVVTTPDQATTVQPFRLTTRHICAASGQDRRQRNGVAAAEWGPWQEAKSAAAVWRAAQRSAPTIGALDPELAAQLPNGLFPIAGATAAPPRVAVGPQEQPAVASLTDPRMDGAVLRGGTKLHVPAADAQGSNEGADDAEDERWVGEPEVAPNVHDVAAAIFAEAKKRGETELGQSHVFRKFIASIRAQCQDSPLIFVVGADWVGGGQSRGARTPGIKLLLRLLEDESLVIYCDEFYTSQLCPRCLSRSEFVRDRDYRSKRCTNEQCQGRPAPNGEVRPFVFGRDVGAAVTFLTGLRFELEHQGVRAPALGRPEKRVVQHPH